MQSSSLLWRPLPTLLGLAIDSPTPNPATHYLCSITASISRFPVLFSSSSSPSGYDFPRRRSSSSSSLTFDHTTPTSSCSQFVTIARRFRCANSSNACRSESHERPDLRRWAEAVGEALSVAFPIWVSLGCLLGLGKPSAFDWVQPRWMMLGMTLNMLGMGMTLTLDDLRGAFSMTRELATGFLLQYTVMPLSGYLVSKLLQLPPYYAAGLILVACCPGGLASNIVTYIARGNVALSVLMTAASTISAIVMTPFLTATLAGHYVSVNALGLVISTLYWSGHV